MPQELENPLFARFYHRFCGRDRGQGERELRRELLTGEASGRPDQREALAEFRRVLGEGGELRFYEHVRSRRPGFARWQRRVDLLWSRMMGGRHTDRDTLAAMVDAGFRMERCVQ